MDRYIFRNFVLGYFFGCFIFLLMSEQSLNFPKMENPDLRLLKNEIVALKLSPERNIFATTFDNPINSFESSIHDIEEVSYKEETYTLVPIDIKTKTSEGKKLVRARKKDFEFLFLMKDKDSYVFTSDRKPNQILRRETITMDVNRVMHSVSNLLPSQPKITSHSFRIGYISQLWKDTKDIEFVRQTIGHRRLDSTSGYVNQMTDQERENRISSIKV
jgi:hypothetical protein